MTKNPVGGKLSACDRERADAALTEEANRCISPLASRAKAT